MTELSAADVYAGLGCTGIDALDEPTFIELYEAFTRAFEVPRNGARLRKEIAAWWRKELAAWPILKNVKLPMPDWAIRFFYDICSQHVIEQVVRSERKLESERLAERRATAVRAVEDLQRVGSVFELEQFGLTKKRCSIRWRSI